MSEPWRLWPTRTWVRAVIITITLILMLVALFQIWSAIVPFLLGLLLSVLLLPFVNWLQRHLPGLDPASRAARVVAVLLVYIAGLGLIAGFLAYVIPVVIMQAGEVFASSGVFADWVQTLFRDLQQWYERGFPPNLRALIDNQAREATGQIAAAAQRAIGGFLSLVGNAIIIILGYLVVPIWVFYVLIYSEQLSTAIMRMIPHGLRPDIVNVGRIANNVLSSYVTGQLLLATIVGILSGLSLSLLGVNFAVLLGFVAAVGDLIPTLGPILATIPAVIIAGLERPILGLWALLALVGVQQLEANILGPYIVGDRVRLNAAVIIILLVVGGALWGFLGLLFIVPLVAMLRDILRYLLIRTGREEVSPDEALRRIHQIQKKQAE